MKYNKSILYLSLFMLCAEGIAVMKKGADHYDERRLARVLETIPEYEKENYKELMKRSYILKQDIADLSSRFPDQDVSESIKQLNEELQHVTRDIIDINQLSKSYYSNGQSNNQAAQHAIERAQQRNLKRRLELEKKKREEEDVVYVQNMRKMQLVETTVMELKSRAVLHGLDDYEKKRVAEMLNEYRMMEADYIFNGTNMMGAQAQRRFVEKFIGDSQAVELTNKRRQKELVDRSIQELAARGVGVMCRSEMKVLDEMLAVYREMGFKLIDLSNSNSPAPSLSQDIGLAQKASQAQKLLIEKYIGTTKRTSACASTKRHFLSKESSF